MDEAKLSATVKVMNVSTTGDARVASTFSVVIGQIHSADGHENEPFKLFYKKFGKRIANTVAESKWIADKIKELSKITQKVATKVRKDLKNLGVGTKDRPYPGFIPKIVKPIKVPEQTKNLLNIKSTLKGRPVKVVPEPKVGDAMKVLEEVVVGPDKHILRPKIIKFPIEIKVFGKAKDYPGAKEIIEKTFDKTEWKKPFALPGKRYVNQPMHLGF